MTLLTRNICTVSLLLLAIITSALRAEGDLSIRWRSGTNTAALKSVVETATDVAQLVPDAGARHIVAQFDRPITRAERAKMSTAGVTLQHYLGDNAYFARITSEGVDHVALSSVPALAVAKPVNRDQKLHPLIVDGVRPTWAKVDTNARGELIIGAYVLFYPDVAFATVGAEAVKKHGGVVRAELRSLNGLVIELTVPQIKALADEDIVQYIEPALPSLDGLNAENRTLVGADIVQAAPYNLDGAGIDVLVYDAGRAVNLVGVPHPDVDPRLTLGDSSPGSAHAAHVTCTVGGDGLQSAGTYRGTAPGVNLISYGFQFDGSNIFLYTNPGDLESDYDQAIGTHGADLANNSIGTNTCFNGFPCTITGDYGVTSALIDAIVGGSLGAPFRVLFANGNERGCTACPGEHIGGYHSTAPPACAKNHITVGAVNANDDTMTTFSSWGPTDDGRLKPDIVGPGCQVGGDLGVTSCNVAGGVFGYTVMCGTSMATPTVTGLAALILQDFRATFPNDPDPRNSSLKVLFAQNAIDVGNPGPDYQNGYGSVRIQPTIEFLRSGALIESRVGHLATYTVFLEVLPGDPELKVTLAWDDVPGTPNVDPALVNDLDLRVFDPLGTEFFPWTLDPANPAVPAVQTTGDHLNNIEQVVIAAPTAGIYRIEVTGFNVPAGPQTFSLAGSPNLMTPDVGAVMPASADRPLTAQHTVTATIRAGLPPFAPVSGLPVTFNIISGPNAGGTSTGTTDAAGQVSYTYTGVDIAGIDKIQATFDDAGSPRVTNIATVSWMADAGTLTPSTSSGNPGEQHTVFLDLTQGAAPFDPIPGAAVTFDVVAGPNIGATGTVTTDINGQASFTYTSLDVAGTDQIQASYFSGGAMQVSNVATHDWLAGQITLAPFATVLNECTDHTVTATLTQGAAPFDPIVAAAVTFEVLTGPNAGTIGTVISDLSGMADFTYTDFGGDGVDQIEASFFNSSATQFSNKAAANWLPNPMAVDCNANGINDGCEMGASLDCNGNGNPDICDVAAIVGFATPVANAVGSNPFAIAAADFDGVQGIDLVTGNPGSNSVSVLLNGGAGAFGTATDYATAESSSGLAVGDFDSDGDIDIANVAQADNVEILINNGNGVFTNGSLTNTLADRAVAIGVGDFDGLNGPDIVVANRNSNNVSVLLNNGNATFATAVPYTAGDRPHALAVADFDGVNGPDIAVVNDQSDTLSILLNNGDGTFPVFPTNSFAGTAPVAITTVDLDGDLDLDLVVSAGGSNTLTIHINNGAGLMQSGGSLSTGVIPEGVAAGDFDGDGDPDLAVANYGIALGTPGTTLSIYLNHGDLTFEPQATTSAGGDFPLALVSADFDGDSISDLAVTLDLVSGSANTLLTQVTRITPDCDGNGVPDSCDPDDDGDGVPNVCDLCPGTFPGSMVDVDGCSPMIVCSSDGLIMLDAVTYNCSDLVFIQVVDCDLDVNPSAIDTVTVTLASTTEPGGESVTLTETAVDSAVFEGTIAIGTANVVGLVQISGGDTLTATYVDADDGLGGTNVAVIDNAAVATNCLDIIVELEGVDTIVTREVTFELTDCDTATVDTQIVSVDFDATGMGTTTLTLPNTNADWISADEAHTLRTRVPLGPPFPSSVAFTAGSQLLGGDFNGDGLVDVEDLSLLASAWNSVGDAADSNGDGIQDTIDFTAIVVNFFLGSDPVDGCP